MMALHPKIIDLTLDRMWRLLDALGNPQEHLPPVIHVAGTNGKGSTLAMIRAGLEADGKRCHVYTSPHL
ncbi:MAG: bifunctional folylpolyglutamate synthase/dihydrofolate synthase, partial [Pseudooceanicola nanhaiensis]